MRTIFFILLLGSIYSCNSSCSDCNKKSNSEESTDSNVSDTIDLDTVYNESMTFVDITFNVSSVSSENGNILKIQTEGLTKSNIDYTFNDNGSEYISKIGDLDRDQWPDLIIISKNDQESKIYCFSVNNGKSMSIAHVDETIQFMDKTEHTGKEEIEYEIVEDVFLSRIKSENGDYWVQCKYELVAGEAMKSLQVEKCDTISASVE